MKKSIHVVTIGLLIGLTCIKPALAFDNSMEAGFTTGGTTVGLVLTGIAGVAIAVGGTQGLIIGGVSLVAISVGSHLDYASSSKEGVNNQQQQGGRYKIEDIQNLITQSELTGEINPEVRSMIDAFKEMVFKKAAIDVSDDEVLEGLAQYLAQ